MIKSDVENSSCEDCQATDCFIKKYCTKESINLISDLKETSVYRENQYIAYEGNAVLGLFFIKSGKSKIISSGLAGKTQVVRLAKTGGIIGHRGYGGDKYPISAVAIEESTICFIDNDTIYKAFMDNPQLTFELMMYYSKELRKSEAKIKSQAQMNVREKVADSILSCDTLFNENLEYPFSIHLSRQDLANLAGINTEQLSRILSEFKREGIIAVSKNEICVENIDLLKEIISPFGVLQ
jgi:CRP-like cAMP-binding protein